MPTDFIIVLFFLLDILIPIVSGPIAAFLYVSMMENNQPNQQVLFWLGYVGWQVIVFFLMAYTLGDLAPGPGFVSCWLIPITAVLSFIILWRAEDGVRQATEGDLAVRRNYQFGLFLIPVMQIVTLMIVLMFGPFMCQLGINTCSTF